MPEISNSFSDRLRGAFSATTDQVKTNVKFIGKQQAGIVLTSTARNSIIQTVTMAMPEEDKAKLIEQMENPLTKASTTTAVAILGAFLLNFLNSAKEEPNAAYTYMADAMMASVANEVGGLLNLDSVVSSMFGVEQVEGNVMTLASGEKVDLTETRA